MRQGMVLLACALAQLISLSAHADNWVIEHVTLIDGIHEPQPDMTVAVAGDRIASVTPSAIARGIKGRRIAGNGKYLIPGLIDVHIHLRGGFDVGGKVDAPLGPPNRAEGVAALASFLYSGVTTVFDAGNRAEHILPLRADERAGKILSPRIFATGNLITYPGSHGDRIAVRISDFEKDKALLDKHIAEQQPDILKLTLEEEGWGSRPMIPLHAAWIFWRRSPATTISTEFVRPCMFPVNCARWRPSMRAPTPSRILSFKAPVSDSFVKLMGGQENSLRQHAHHR